MKTWDEFISWLSGFPKTRTLFVYDDSSERLEAVPYGVVGDSELQVQHKMIQGITEIINRSESVWIRWMPEIHQLTDRDGKLTGKYKGYMRIAFREKVPA